MRFTSRTALAALMMMLFMGLAGTATASATSWWVGKAGGGEEQLKTGVREELSEVASTKEHYVLEFHKKEYRYECSTLQLEKGFLEGPSAIGLSHLSLKGCKVTRPVGCEIAGGEFKSASEGKVLSRLLAGPPTSIEFEADEQFGSYRLINCGPLTGQYQLKGAMKGELVNAGVCEKEKQLHFKEEPSKLITMGEAFGKFEGTAVLALKSGKCWDAH